LRRSSHRYDAQHDGAQQAGPSPGSGFRASMIAETTWFSTPRPGAQPLIVPRLAGFSAMRISVNPAPRSQASISVFGAAPATQPHSRVGSARSSADSGTILITSDTASRPPGF